MSRDVKVGIAVLAGTLFCLLFVAFVDPTPVKEELKEQDGFQSENKRVVLTKSREDLLNDSFEIDVITLNNDLNSENQNEKKYIPPQASNAIHGEGNIEQANPNPLLRNIARDSNTPGVDLKTSTEQTEKPIAAEPEQKKAEATILPEESKKLPKEEPERPSILQEDTYYTVKSGDTLSKIALFFYQDATKHKDISKANQGLKSVNLKVGQKIFLPSIHHLTKINEVVDVKPQPMVKADLNQVAKDVEYIVKRGDTASSIAQKFYGKASQYKIIEKANPRINLNKLKIGDKLLLPGKQD